MIRIDKTTYGHIVYVNGNTYNRGDHRADIIDALLDKQ